MQMYEKALCGARERGFCIDALTAVGEIVAVGGEVLSVKDAKMSTSLRLSWLASVL